MMASSSPDSAPEPRTIHLDTNELINLIERDRPMPAEEFDGLLRQHDMTLVVSWSNVWEMAEAIRLTPGESRTWADFNRIERLPVIYIQWDRTRHLELCEAIRAFKAGGEFVIPMPFKDRMDQVAGVKGESPMRDRINFPLCEYVSDILRHIPNPLRRLRFVGPALRERLELDHGKQDHISPLDHFRAYMRRTLGTHGIAFSESDAYALADWIWENPSRCPAIRLIDSIWGHMMRNRQNIEDNDVLDFDALACVPYTDFSTLDGRMHDYVSRTRRDLRTPYADHVFRNLPQLLDAVEGT